MLTAKQLRVLPVLLAGLIGVCYFGSGWRRCGCATATSAAVDMRVLHPDSINNLESCVFPQTVVPHVDDLQEQLHPLENTADLAHSEQASSLLV